MWLVSPRSKAQAHVCLPVHGAPWWVLLQHSIMLQLFFIVKCGIMHFLCAMRVFKVQASSPSPWLPLCQISFLSRVTTSVAVLAHGEKLRTHYSVNQSLTHPAYLMSREPKLALRNKLIASHRQKLQVYLTLYEHCDTSMKLAKPHMHVVCGSHDHVTLTFHHLLPNNIIST